MKVDKVEVSLESSDKYGLTNTFELIAGNKELLVCAQGKVVARITTTVMEKDIKDEDGAYHTKPTKNFFLQFCPEDTCGLGKDFALVVVEDIGVKQAADE